MLPLALPLAPDTIEIHEALLEPLHGHPPAVVTDTEVPVDPAAGMDIVVGVKVYGQDAEGCDTVTVCPATVKVPLRPAFVSMFSEARKDTDASSDPLVADVMVSHVALLATVQAHPVCVSIVI